MIVKRLFWEDAYKTRWKAKITSIDRNKIKLDKSVFYAFSGGQISDEGTINGIKVVNAKILEDYDIEYELESEPNFNQEEIVEVKIDWEKRYELMKLHTAQHIVADLFQRETGISKTLGGNIRLGKSTLTYSTDEVITETLIRIEEKANELIKIDLKVESYTDKSDENKRHWRCNEFQCPCGGTHVKSLREIGEVKLKRKNGGKGKEIIEIMLK